jgi:hypothetical protein
MNTGQERSPAPALAVWKGLDSFPHRMLIQLEIWLGALFRERSEIPVPGHCLTS